MKLDLAAQASAAWKWCGCQDTQGSVCPEGLEQRIAMLGAAVPAAGGIPLSWYLALLLLKLPQFCRKHSAGAFPRQLVSWAATAPACTLLGREPQGRGGCLGGGFGANIGLVWREDGLCQSIMSLHCANKD